jgi:hypothetical protein
MGAISRSGYKRLLIGNTPERILDELSCDVMVVKPAKFRSRVPRLSRGRAPARERTGGGTGLLVQLLLSRGTGFGHWSVRQNIHRQSG